VSRNLRYTEDELREQWSFIDALVDSQASALRSGARDPEEDETQSVTQDAQLLREVSDLRERVRTLEAERDVLRERLRAVEAQRAPAPVASRQVLEARVRNWWRRVSR